MKYIVSATLDKPEIYENIMVDAKSINEAKKLGRKTFVMMYPYARILKIDAERQSNDD